MRPYFFVAAAMRNNALLLATALAVLGSSAQAEMLNYSLSNKGQTLTFSLDSQQDAVANNGVYFEVFTDVSTSGRASVQQIIEFAPPGNAASVCLFAVANLQGQTSICDASSGNSYFYGSVESPTLLAGRYGFSDNDTGTPVYLNVTYASAESPSSVTPEPSSLALLGTGLLCTIGILRKRFI